MELRRPLQAQEHVVGSHESQSKLLYFLVGLLVGILPTYMGWRNATTSAGKFRCDHPVPRHGFGGWAPSNSSYTGINVNYSSSTVFYSLQDALKNPEKVCMLDLSSSGLDQLPADIARFVNLEWLDLHGTRIASLPVAIGKLHNLVYLDITYTPISQLPPEIGEIKSLQYLEASHTNITTLPPEFSDLIGLREMGLSGNHITQIPDAIWGLGNLEALDLSFNEITELPSMTQFTASGLRYLNLYRNRIRGLNIPDYRYSYNSYVTIHKQLDLRKNPFSDYASNCDDLQRQFADTRKHVKYLELLYGDNERPSECFYNMTGL